MAVGSFKKEVEGANNIARQVLILKAPGPATIADFPLGSRLVAMFKPQQVREFIRRYRVDDGSRFRLRDHNPADTGRLKSDDKDGSKEVLQEGVKWLAEMQERLYAQDCWSLLLIFQAMDAAGKDGAIRHVM